MHPHRDQISCWHSSTVERRAVDAKIVVQSHVPVPIRVSARARPGLQNRRLLVSTPATRAKFWMFTMPARRTVGALRHVSLKLGEPQTFGYLRDGATRSSQLCSPA